MAAENGASELTEGAVIGKSLFSFIAGDPTRMFIESMIQAVRFRHEPVRQVYRCDSPTLRRDMEMLLLPDSGEGVRVIHRTLRVSPLLRPRFFQQAEHASRNVSMRCSMCNRLNRHGRWWQPDEAPIRENLVGTHLLQPIEVIYCVCADCRQELKQNYPCVAAG